MMTTTPQEPGEPDPTDPDITDPNPTEDVPDLPGEGGEIIPGGGRPEPAGELIGTDVL
jgi:hypothetical protein